MTSFIECQILGNILLSKKLKVCCWVELSTKEIQSKKSATLLSAYSVPDTNQELLISRWILRQLVSKKCVESEALFVTL